MDLCRLYEDVEEDLGFSTLVKAIITYNPRKQEDLAADARPPCSNDTQLCDRRSW